MALLWAAGDKISSINGNRQPNRETAAIVSNKRKPEGYQNSVGAFRARFPILLNKFKANHAMPTVLNTCEFYCLQPLSLRV